MSIGPPGAELIQSTQITQRKSIHVDKGKHPTFGALS